jgi:hypothetical protein
MSNNRRNNPGRRERAAGKRHRRARISSGATVGWLKVGSRHSSRCMRRILAVADAEKRLKGMAESDT